MKKGYVFLLTVLLVCAAASAVLVILSPDVVPVHYNFSGEADRFGSRYENLLFPAIALALGAFFGLAAKSEGKKKNNSSEKLLLTAGCVTLSLFTLISLILLANAAFSGPGVSLFDPAETPRLVNVGLGTLLIVMGNLMPKARRNATVGLRTKWSMSSDEVWRKSQRFGAFALVTAGGAMILFSLFVPGMWNLIATMTFPLAAGIVSTVASYRYSRASSRDADGAGNGAESDGPEE